MEMALQNMGVAEMLDAAAASETLNVPEFAKMACVLCDVPVHGATGRGLIEALHLVFSVYVQFQQLQHFQQSGAASTDAQVVESFMPGQDRSFDTLIE